MIEKRTVFVLGAGASCPYGFPTALKLRNEIIENFQNSYGRLLSGLTAADRIRKGFPDDSAVATFIRRFDDSNTESIDLFLSRHPESGPLGKLAILFSISGKEESSCFGGRVQKPEHDWYFYLYNRLTRELVDKDGYKKFGESNISFVTFNYDRSFEHFLFNSLLSSFEGAEQGAIREQVEAVPVVHVYGRIAPLPWQDGTRSMVLEYGGYRSLHIKNLLGMTDNLHVVHEQRQNPEIERARDEISKADQVFFLGFGYAKENLEALGFPDVVKKNHRIYGTAMGGTPKEVEEIRRDFIYMIQRTGNASANVGDQVQIRDCDCVALLQEFL